MEAELNHRARTATAIAIESKTAPKPPTTTTPKPKRGEAHPAGEAKHGKWMQFLRGLSLTTFFVLSVGAIAVTQLIGAPLYWYDRDMYYAYMAYTKQSFALAAMSVTEWWGPTKIRMSGDASVAGQIRQTSDGRVEFSFPERLVLVANHQLYTDWLYLWWAGYANAPQMHGHLYIILKESLQWMPVLGTGMMFYGFIFMSRKMAVDQHRLAYRLQKLKRETAGPPAADGTTKKKMAPMWLLLFPEGTNMTIGSKERSAAWAAKNGYKTPEHVLLPRSTGTMFCLKELRGTVDYIYDCTVAYEGIPRGECGENYFTLSSTYIQGRPPKSVNFHWRRFKLSDIPLDDATKFDEWLRERFYEKDALLDQYLETGRFPPLEGTDGDECKKGYVETEVRPKVPLEFVHIFSVLIGLWMVRTVLLRMWSTMMTSGW